MPPRLLLDTHIAIRWITESKKLSREQARVLDGVVRRQEEVALCALSLLETAILASQGKLKMKLSVTQFFGELQANSVLPITYEVASEAALLANFARTPPIRPSSLPREYIASNWSPPISALSNQSSYR